MSFKKPYFSRMPVWIKSKPRKFKYITGHNRPVPFSIGQIIFNSKRPSVKRLVLEEPKLVRKVHYGHTRPCWEIKVLNIRKSANNGKKSKILVEVGTIKNFAVFSDIEVACV